MAIKVIKIKHEFKDVRGFISRVVDSGNNINFSAVLLIYSKKGTVRANHYHKTDSHYVYCLSGKFRYSEKDMRKPLAKTESVILKPGDLVLSRSMIAHRMEFLDETTFLAITTEPRDPKKYEKDTVRLNF